MKYSSADHRPKAYKEGHPKVQRFSKSNNTDLLLQSIKNQIFAADKPVNKLDTNLNVR